MFLFTSPISVSISEVFVYLLPIRSFPDSPKYRADPISDPVIGSGLGVTIRRKVLSSLKKNGSKAVLRIEPVALQHPELLGLNIFNGYKENYIPATFSTLDKVLGPRWDVRKYSNSSYAAATSAEFSFNIQQCFITVKLKYAYIADEWTPLYRNYIQERLNEANQC